jgi:uncharacterized protein (TIGR02246 family)
MTTNGAIAAMRDPRSLVAMVILMLAAPLTISVAHANATQDASRAADDAAVRQVVAGFSDGWNRHDARSMCASVAEDVRWVGWRGDVSQSRKEVEDNHAALFADLYKNTHRTDIVKSIRYLGPGLALVDDFWTMTGARTREGADWPYRAGYASFLMTKRDGRWIVIVSHTADFNAKAPAEK